jgi:hypothetical protein
MFFNKIIPDPNAVFTTTTVTSVLFTYVSNGASLNENPIIELTTCVSLLAVNMAD